MEENENRLTEENENTAQDVRGLKRLKVEVKILWILVFSQLFLVIFLFGRYIAMTRTLDLAIENFQLLIDRGEVYYQNFECLYDRINMILSLLKN